MKFIILLSFLAGSALASSSPTAIEATQKIAGNYVGNWEMYGYRGDQLQKIMAWTDTVKTSQPIQEKDRVYVKCENTMTYANGGSYILHWTEGYFMNADGSAGDRYFNTNDVISIEREISPELWIIEATAYPQELGQLGLPEGATGKHMTVKKVTHHEGYNVEWILRYTIAYWTTQEGPQSKEFLSMKGYHKHLLQ